MKPLAGERSAAALGAAIGLILFSLLAIYAVVIADDVAVWIRALLVLMSCFFAWLLFFAPTKVRIAVIRWFPWWC